MSKIKFNLYKINKIRLSLQVYRKLTGYPTIFNFIYILRYFNLFMTYFTFILIMLCYYF
jgi:hypothetical protein